MESTQPEVLAEDDVVLCENCSKIVDDDCGCSVCEGCSERVGDTCSRCDNCPDCCECAHCNCGRTYDPDDECSNCNSCTRCCGCSICEECGSLCDSNDGLCCESGDDEDPEDRNGLYFCEVSPRFHVPKKLQCKRNPSPRLLAVEIEVARIVNGHPTNAPVGKWGCSVVTDGSLPDGTGFEINSAPAGGDLFVKQVEELCAALNEGQAKVTTACGLHVHADARDLDRHELRKLVKLYARLEPAFYALIPQSRRNSTYCQPCGDRFMASLEGQYDRHAVTRAIYALDPRFEGKPLHKCKDQDRMGKLKKCNRDKYHEARYSGLNVHSWYYRQTVECRLHSGTTDATKIINWGMLWASVVDEAVRINERELEALPYRPGRDVNDKESFELLLRIAPASTRDYFANRKARFAQ